MKINPVATQRPVADAMERSDEIDLGQLALTLWRGKFIIGGLAALGFVIGVWYGFLQAVPVYTAKATVALESRDSQVTDLASVMTGLSGDQATINTEVEVIRSRVLAGQLVDQLDLIKDPEFNGALKKPNKLAPGAIIRKIIDVVTGSDSTPATLSVEEQRERTINSALNAIQVSNVRQSYVFSITAVTKSPVKSALFANTLAEIYIQDQVNVKFEATERATAWLSERVLELQTELEASEARLKEFSTNTDLISPEGLMALNRQLKELRDRRDVLTRDAEEAAKLAADMQSGSYNAQSTPQMIERAKLNAERLAGQRDSLSASIADLEARIDRQSEELVKLQQFQREAEASRLIYEYFLARLKETSVQQGIQQPDSRLLSPAVIPPYPSAPRKSLIAVLAAFLGGFAGIAIVLGKEFTQRTFRAAEELEAKTGYHVLGQIPSIPARRRHSILQYLIDKPTSAAAEAVRNLRVSVLLSDIDNPPQIIMSTSSLPGEGKTTQSIALTQNLSGLGKKVLLVEGDIRRRVFTEYFDTKGKKGIIAVLAGEATLEDVVIRDERLGADILVGDRPEINAADVFSSEKFANFMEGLKSKYDYIVVDTPPVLVVPDARIIAQHVDAVIYTVKWDSTRHRQVLDGLKAFESVNVKVAGLVLGQVSPKGMKRYGYGDSYGAYAAYNGYYDN